MKRKHYLLYGHGGSYNHGGEAITRTTVEWLRRISPDCYITLSTHFPEQDMENGIQVDEMVARDMNGKTNAEIYRETLERITADTTVIHVGGDNYCYQNWQRYAEIHKKAKLVGGKSIYWGCSIDEDCIDEEMLEVLREHDLILARESITSEALRKKGLCNVTAVCDIAFTMEPETTDICSEDYVVVNLSPLVFRKNEKVMNAVDKVVDFFINGTKKDVLLVPHVVIPVDNDYDILSELKKRWNDPRVVLVSDRLSAKQYKSIISKAKMCIASRTHVVIAALSSCVPAVSIGYSTKAKGIAKDLGFFEYVIDIFDENIEDNLLSCCQQLYYNEERMRAMLTAQMESYKNRALPESVVNFLKEE